MLLSVLLQYDITDVRGMSIDQVEDAIRYTIGE